MLLAALLLGSPAGAAEAAPAEPGELPRFSLTLGVNGAPLLNHLGFEVRAAHVAWRWRLGELALGGQLVMHFFPPTQPAQPGVTLRALDLSLRLHAVVGHAFALAGRRLLVGTHVFSGPSLRILERSLRDPLHAVAVDERLVEPLFEVGAMLVLTWCVGDRLSVNGSLAVPLWVSGSNAPVKGWLAAPPFVGASLTFSL